MAWVIMGMDISYLTFCSRTYHTMHRQNASTQNASGQKVGRNSKGGQNAGHFFFAKIYHTDD